MFLVGAAGACGKQELGGLNGGEVDRHVPDYFVAPEMDGRPAVGDADLDVGPFRLVPHHHELALLVHEFFAVGGAGLPVELLDGDRFFAIENLDGGRLAAAGVPGVEADPEGRVGNAFLCRIGQGWQVVADADAQAVRRPARAPAHEHPEADFKFIERRAVGKVIDQHAAVLRINGVGQLEDAVEFQPRPSAPGALIHEAL